MNSRIKALRSLFTQHNIDALLVLSDVNIRYLTKFPASESWLLVTKSKVYYITDFRYVLEVKAGLKGVVLKQYTKSIYEMLFSIVKDAKVKRLGFDEHSFSVAQHKVLKRHQPKNVKLVGSNGLVEDLREVKEAEEIKAIRQALKIHREALKYIKRYIKPGNTERYVFEKLENFVKSKRVGFSFDPIVASGPNSCFPHAHVTDRKIRNNEPVLLDMGIDYKGYKSDLTRMFFLGKIPNLIQKVNDYVAQAQALAIESIKAGTPIAYVDQQARNFLEKKKLAKYFGHALGHGVGLDIHERPRLAQSNSSVLREGMVITIEPAVYLPNKFGIRIEDMVLVKKKGYEIL